MAEDRDRVKICIRCGANYQYSDNELCYGCANCRHTHIEEYPVDCYSCVQCGKIFEKEELDLEEE